MAQQNINQYNFKKWYVKSVPKLYDISLASDERSFNEEVAISPYIIAENDGNTLPIYFDLDSYYCNQKLDLQYGIFNSGNTLISKNYYNPNNDNLYLITAQTLCDIGLTGIDNGLVNEMTGMTISYTNGLTNSALAFDRHAYDRRLKLIQVTAHTDSPNFRFSANTAQTVYEIVSKSSNIFGDYHHLYGGFYQGFFKLFGYDYEAFPNRTNKGWSVEMILKARQQDQYSPSPGQVTLNDVYPENSNIFFYFGARAENKFYYDDPNLLNLNSCSCSETGNTNSRCVDIYSQSSMFPNNPLLGSISNNFALRLQGDKKNPQVCVKVLKMTGRTVIETVTGTTTVDGILPCETDATKILTGYTVDEYCSTTGIFDYCSQENPDYLNKEHWFQVNCVWERNNFYENEDLEKFGGLGVITTEKYVLPDLELINTSGKPPGLCDQSVVILGINDGWIVQKDYRLGSLKIYVNGKLLFVINGFEEVIPRGLDTEKEKQLGVPFNISWGGGTQGLRESLSFNKKPECDISFGVEIPLEFTTEISSGSVNIKYTLKNLFPINQEVNFTFIHVLGKKDGTKITVNSEVVIPANSTIGETVVVVDDDYNLLNGQSSFTKVSLTPSNLDSNFKIDFTNEFITPTPTPTPTITPTKTPTPTPTPSATPICVQFITDELGNTLITENSDNIVSEYNVCITPTPTPSMTPTSSLTPTLTPTL